MKQNIQYTRDWSGRTSDWKPEKRKDDGFMPFSRQLVLQIMPWDHGVYAKFELYEEYMDDRDEREISLPYWQRKCRQQLWYRNFYDKDHPDLAPSMGLLASDARGRYAEDLAYQLYWNLVIPDEEFGELMPGVIEYAQMVSGDK